MSGKFRTGTPHHRLATAQDLQNAIKRGPLAEVEQELPCQPRPFLSGLPPVGVTYNPQQKATKQLKLIIDTNYYAAFFENAIKKVSKQRIPELDRIKTLDQFYFYVDVLVTWIPEIRVWDWYGETLHERTVYLRITQFYYYFNQPQLEALQSPIEPQEGKELSPISLWLRDFAVEWGAFLNTAASTEYLSSFKYAPEYAWQDYQKAPEEYPNFNAFFARQFKDINVQRPVAQPKNDKVIVFPAESTFVGQWAVSTKVGPPLAAPPSIVVKNIEWSIRELLQDSDYADDFEGGIFCHSFLNTYDYHRMHTPVAGKVLEAKFIPGQVYLEVELTVNADEEGNKEPANIVTPKRLLDAEDNTGYQFVQCRGLLVLESSIGKVAILPMGMAQVSSVVFVTPRDEGHQPIELSEEEKRKLDYNQQVKFLNEKIQGCLTGKNLSKGEMFSYFQFGGSDCVMVFERKANVNITAQTNVHYPIRSQYAIANS
ncbi:phosphatidylserine decarboxylase [Zooshikella sp. RANM57]|uniref:phosphatidylserine decarboxylase n=1 Tax=Zooshikella sp. RANM57 TaxID=3425863 RepID=UPI003D6E337C